MLSGLFGVLEREDDVVRRLAEACRGGDVPAVRAVLDVGVVCVCDGGSLVAQEADDVARLVSDICLGCDVAVESVNGRAGLAVRRVGTAVAVVSVSTVDDVVVALWIVLAPAKLSRWHRR